jgi:hypothetical protein
MAWHGMTAMELPGGARIYSPLERASAFLVEEYDYYDAVPSTDPFVCGMKPQAPAAGLLMQPGRPPSGQPY